MTSNNGQQKKQEAKARDLINDLLMDSDVVEAMSMLDVNEELESRGLNSPDIVELVEREKKKGPSHIYFLLRPPRIFGVAAVIATLILTSIHLNHQNVQNRSDLVIEDSSLVVVDELSSQNDSDPLTADSSFSYTIRIDTPQTASNSDFIAGIYPSDLNRDECAFDPLASPLPNINSVFGSADGAVLDGTKVRLFSPNQQTLEIVTYIDPACPHCWKNYYEMRKLAETSVNAQFYFVPVSIGNYSSSRVRSLYLAAEEDVFFDMLEAQIKLKPVSGLSDTELLKLFHEIGLDTAYVAKKLNNGTYWETATTIRNLLYGIKDRLSLPLTTINGQVLTSSEISCISSLISNVPLNNIATRSPFTSFLEQ